MADRIETVVSAPGAQETTEKFHKLTGAHRALHGAVHNLTHEFPALGRAMNLALRQVELSTAGLFTLIGVMAAGAIAIKKVHERTKELEEELKKLNEEAIEQSIRSQIKLSDAVKEASERHREFNEKIEAAVLSIDTIEQALGREQKAMQASASAASALAQAEESLAVAKLEANRERLGEIEYLKQRAQLEEAFANRKVALTQQTAAAEIAAMQRVQSVRNSIQASLELARRSAEGRLAAIQARAPLPSEESILKQLTTGRAAVAGTQGVLSEQEAAYAAEVASARERGLLPHGPPSSIATNRALLERQQAGVSQLQRLLGQIRARAGEEAGAKATLGAVSGDVVKLAGETSKGYADIAAMGRQASEALQNTIQVAQVENETRAVQLGKALADVHRKFIEQILQEYGRALRSRP